MPKRVFIIHGWEGYPEEGWFPWLKKELEKKGFEVHVPAMPHPSTPTIEDWVQHLATTVGEVDENAFFIGHSIGCQTILRYLQTLPSNKKIGGVVCVAGWFSLTGLGKGEEQELAQPWLETPINFEKIKSISPRFIAIFSDNDKWVSLENKKVFEEKLDAETSIEHNKGHLGGYDGITELLSALEAIIKLASGNVFNADRDNGGKGIKIDDFIAKL